MSWRTFGLIGDVEPALDWLAVVAVAIALIPLPLLGIGNPLTQVIALVVVCVFVRQLVRPGMSRSGAISSVGLAWPAARFGWALILAGGIGSGLLKCWLDAHMLHGQGGIAFYQQVLNANGLRAADGSARWALLALDGPVLFAVILIDGIFFSGLIQGRIARRTNLHVGVHSQALLFALPHTFATATPDPIYGFFTYLAGVAYGYVFAVTRSHWMPAALLWLHVMTVWIVLLRSVTPVPAG